MFGGGAGCSREPFSRGLPSAATEPLLELPGRPAGLRAQPESWWEQTWEASLSELQETKLQTPEPAVSHGVLQQISSVWGSASHTPLKKKRGEKKLTRLFQTLKV